MGAAVVYIVYALDDQSDVSKIADAVKKTGWSICFGHTADPIIDPTMNRQRLASADCVLVVWSANAANSSVLRSDALEAAMQHKLVQVSLDDVAPPARGQATVRLRGWCDGADEEAINAVITEIGEHAGPGKGRGSVVPYVVRQLPSLTWVKGSAAALIGVSVSLAIVFGEFGGGSVRHESLGATSDVSSSPTEFAGTSVDVAQAIAGSAPQFLAAERPEIRGFLAESENHLASNGMAAAGEAAEQAAWLSVLDHEDLPTQLSALGSFRNEFSFGVHMFDAAQLQGEQRAALREIRANLVFLGFIPPRGGNDVMELRAGVEAFEKSIGLRPSGSITASLMQSLVLVAEGKAAVVSR